MRHFTRHFARHSLRHVCCFINVLFCLTLDECFAYGAWLQAQAEKSLIWHNICYPNDRYSEFLNSL